MRRGDSLQAHCGARARAEAQLLEDECARAIRTASMKASACASRASRSPTRSRLRHATEAETKVAAIDAARGEAQREVRGGRSGARRDHASHRQRRTDARPAALGRSQWRWKRRPRPTWRTRWCRPRRAREPVSRQPGRGTRARRWARSSVSQGWPIPSITRCATTVRSASRPPRRWASTPTGCRSRRRSCATSTSSRPRQPVLLGPETQARLLTRLARDLRTAAPRLSRQAAG